MFIERGEVETAIGGSLETGRAVGRDRDRAENPFERPDATVGERGGATAVVVHRFWQVLHDQQFFDGSGFDAGGIAAKRHIGEKQCAGGF